MTTVEQVVEAPARVADERAAAGKAARAELPRSAHGEWEPSADRPDPVDLLEEQSSSRVPELVPIRYGRMLVSPFTFYRGAALPMAADLAGAPRTGLQVQLCGDAHLANFGAFAAPDRTLVFSVNDFDETLPGPFEWDVKRLAASFAVAGRDRGFGAKERRAINTAVTRAYREATRRFAGMGNLELWYSRIQIDDVFERITRQGSAKQIKRAGQNVAKARSKDSLRAFGKLTEQVNGRLRIKSDPPLIVPIEELVPPAELHLLGDYIEGAMQSYRRTLTPDLRRLLDRFCYVHAARKVVGVGSVGTRAWIVLLLGRDAGDPLFLQFKEAQTSVLEPFLGRSEFTNQGRRVVEGQRLTQAAGDILLGWINTTDLDGNSHDLYVRQLWDQKGRRWASTQSSAAGRWPRRTLAPVTRSRSPRISAEATPSTVRLPPSPRRTPTRTSATTALYRTRSRLGASWQSTASSPGSSHRDDEHPERRAYGRWHEPRSPSGTPSGVA